MFRDRSIFRMFDDGCRLTRYTDVAGGKMGTGTKSVDTVSAFNTTSRKWLTSIPAVASRIPEPRDHVGGAVVGNKLYVIGGRDTETSNVKDTVYILDLDNLAAGWKKSNGYWSVVQRPSRFHV